MGYILFKLRLVPLPTEVKIPIERVYELFDYPLLSLKFYFVTEHHANATKASSLLIASLNETVHPNPIPNSGAHPLVARYIRV